MRKREMRVESKRERKKIRWRKERERESERKEREREKRKRERKSHTPEGVEDVFHEQRVITEKIPIIRCEGPVLSIEGCEIVREVHRMIFIQTRRHLSYHGCRPGRERNRNSVCVCV